ncbi:MAG: GntR family transcriptional regulator [Planctomycetes bacterium]|nr:GntR family transcriptional regulator [Planctomycetota bacterium]
MHTEVAERIKEMIAHGYAPGDTLPTHQDLTKILNVGRVTITRAIEVLTSQGIVSAMPSRGTTVCQRVKPGAVSLSRIGIIAMTSMGGLFRGGYLSEILRAVAGRIEMLEADMQFFTGLRYAQGPSMEEIADSGVDGVILLGVIFHDYIAEAATWGVPVVVVDHHDPGIALDYIVPDNAGACAAVVNHLAELGHRKLAYFDSFIARKPGPTGGTRMDCSANERREGILRAARAAGIQVHTPMFRATLPPIFLQDPSRRVDINDLVEVLKAGRDAPTAVVADSEASVNYLLRHLGEVGIRIPQDVSLAATAGPARAEATATTGCRVNFPEMGEQAVELLQFRSRRPGPFEAHVVRIGFEFIKGATTAAAPR